MYLMGSFGVGVHQLGGLCEGAGALALDHVNEQRHGSPTEAKQGHCRTVGKGWVHVCAPFPLPASSRLQYPGSWKAMNRPSVAGSRQQASNWQ